MQWKRTGVVVALSLLALVAGCQSMTGRTAGENVDDAAITASVKSKLAADRAGSLTSIDVDTVSGTVYLTGTVPDASAKERAGELARDVDGVRSVVNNLNTRGSMAGDAPDTDERDTETDY